MEKQFIAYFLLASVLGASGAISNCDTEKNISLVTESSVAHSQIDGVIHQEKIDDNAFHQEKIDPDSIS